MDYGVCVCVKNAAPQPEAFPNCNNIEMLEQSKKNNTQIWFKVHQGMFGCAIAMTDFCCIFNSFDKKKKKLSN